MHYPNEVLHEDHDDGTMPANVAELGEAVIGHRIANVTEIAYVPEQFQHMWKTTGAVLTLDNGKQVYMFDTDDCCAYTSVEGILRHIDQIDHIITGVGTTEGYTKWHIYADLGDVLELTVGWSCGNPFYYGYGFNIQVVDDPDAPKQLT